MAQKKIRVRGHRFSDAPAMYMKRTKFGRSHVYKTTFDSGKLIPVFVDEVLPGDTTRMSVNYFALLATPIKPIMDNIYLDWFFFLYQTALFGNTGRISVLNRKTLMIVLIMSFLLLLLLVTLKMLM